jgi:Holliday junction resolvase RusA-like endonuclease
MQEVSFSVPLIPESVNHLWKVTMYTGADGYAHRGRKLSKPVKAYYEAVAIFAGGRTVSPVTDAERRKVRYHVTVDVYLGRRQRGDADNFSKSAVDGLVKAGVIHSDANVETCTVTVHKDERDNPRTEYKVVRMERNDGTAKHD